MIAALIRWSVANRFLVLLATLFVTAWGIWSVQSTPIDALPDLSVVHQDQRRYAHDVELLGQPGLTVDIYAAKSAPTAVFVGKLLLIFKHPSAGFRDFVLHD